MNQKDIIATYRDGVYAVFMILVLALLIAGVGVALSGHINLGFVLISPALFVVGVKCVRFVWEM